MASQKTSALFFPNSPPKEHAIREVFKQNICKTFLAESDLVSLGLTCTFFKEATQFDDLSKKINALPKDLKILYHYHSFCSFELLQDIQHFYELPDEEKKSILKGIFDQELFPYFRQKITDSQLNFFYQGYQQRFFPIDKIKQCTKKTEDMTLFHLSSEAGLALLMEKWASLEQFFEFTSKDNAASVERRGSISLYSGEQRLKLLLQEYKACLKGEIRMEEVMLLPLKELKEFITGACQPLTIS